MEHLSGADEGIAVIKMNRPSAKNALGKVFMDQLSSSLNTLKHSKTRVIIIKSMLDTVFCAGADLKVCNARFHREHLHSALFSGSL